MMWNRLRLLELLLELMVVFMLFFVKLALLMQIFL